MAINEIKNPYIRKPVTVLLTPILCLSWIPLRFTVIIQEELSRAWRNLCIISEAQSDFRDIKRSISSCWRGPGDRSEKLTGIQNGKTKHLVNLAKSKSAAGKRVLIVLPTIADVRNFKDSHQISDITVLSHHQAFFNRSFNRFTMDYVLLDDCEQMDLSNGDPMDLAKSFYRGCSHQPVIIGAYSVEEGSE